MPSPPDVKQPAIFFSLFQVRRVPVPPFALPSLPQCLNRREIVNKHQKICGSCYDSSTCAAPRGEDRPIRRNWLGVTPDHARKVRANALWQRKPTRELMSFDGSRELESRSAAIVSRIRISIRAGVDPVSAWNKCEKRDSERPTLLAMSPFEIERCRLASTNRSAAPILGSLARSASLDSGRIVSAEVIELLCGLQMPSQLPKVSVKSLP
jgi:hypothetical protein